VEDLQVGEKYKYATFDRYKVGETSFDNETNTLYNMGINRIVLWGCLLTLSFLSMASGGCSKKGKSAKSQAMNSKIDFAGVWLHSYEDEKENGAKCYRPKSYDFPPSRGRGGIKFTLEGTFAELRIAPNDAGHVEYPGKYKYDDATKLITIDMEDGRKLNWELVSLENGLLKIKELQP